MPVLETLSGALYGFFEPPWAESQWNPLSSPEQVFWLISEVRRRGWTGVDIIVLDTGVGYCTITGSRPMGWGSSGRRGRDTQETICLAVCLAVYDAILKVRMNENADSYS